MVISIEFTGKFHKNYIAFKWHLWLVWTIWTPMPAVPKKAVKLHHSLTPWHLCRISWNYWMEFSTKLEINFLSTTVDFHPEWYTKLHLVVKFQWNSQGEVHLIDFYRHFSRMSFQAPVPLSIFRSNSKFDENSKHSSVKYTWPITTIFCTCHDSATVVTYAKYRCDRSSIFETKAFWIFIEFRIRSNYV